MSRAFCVPLLLFAFTHSAFGAAVGDGDHATSTTNAADSVAVAPGPSTNGFSLAWPLGLIILVTLFSTLLFHVWLRRQGQLDHDQKLKSWEIFFKMVGTVAVIAGGMIAVSEYLADRERYLAESKRQHERQIEQRDHELNMRLFDTTSQVYSELLDVTAELAFAESRDANLVRQFEQLYHGRLMMVESVDVARLARECQFRLRHWQDGEPRPDDLPMLSLRLAAACRNHLQLFEVGKGMPARVGKTEDVLAETQETFATAP